jgi:hypothetical protein
LRVPATKPPEIPLLCRERLSLIAFREGVKTYDDSVTLNAIAFHYVQCDWRKVAREEGQDIADAKRGGTRDECNRETG